jgi:hypothetical protein
MDNEDIRQGHDSERESAPITYHAIEEKIQVQLKVMFRVDLDRAPIVKRSFEKWAQQWIS